MITRFSSDSFYMYREKFSKTEWIAGNFKFDSYQLEVESLQEGKPAARRGRGAAVKLTGAKRGTAAAVKQDPILYQLNEDGQSFV